MANKHKTKIAKIPSEYADMLGNNFIASKEKKDLALMGQYFTPQNVAELMAKNFSEITTTSAIKILDPGAGAGMLSCLLAEKISEWKHKPKQIEIIAYEIDKSLIPILKKSFGYLQDWLVRKKILLSFNIQNNDFVLENADILSQSLQQTLFNTKKLEKFDIIVANPPYFKIPKSDPRAKATASIVHGQPNIYALFMAIAASLLKDKGQLGFITPRSYASGLYFKKFRQNFFNKITPISIHIFESRDKAFNKDGVLQENVILHAKKDSALDKQKYNVKITSCNGLTDIKNLNMIDIPLSEIISPEDDYVLHIPTKVTQREVVKIVKSWKHNLRSLGLEVSTGPIVPFRARNILKMESDYPSAPLFWLHNVKMMQVYWPLKSRKPQYVKMSQETKKLLVPNRNYVLVRRFSAKEEKKRLVAAPLFAKTLKSEFVGIENHINYIYSRSGKLSDTETFGLAAILNCSLLDSYFRIFNGNTQVSATELRNMPLPAPKVIEKIGLIVKNRFMDQENMDEKIVNLIKQYA